MTPGPPDQVRFVYFDVGGTMLRVQTSVGDVYSRAAAEHGFQVSSDWLVERFQAAWKDSLQRSAERSYKCSDEILREEWFTIVRDTFGSSIPESHIAPLFDDLYDQFVSPSAWTPVDGVEETLRHLGSLGLRLGILSNWDHRLRRTLEQLGLADFFSVWVVSHEVGYEKPHAAIFEEAVSRASEEPGRILFVGDSWESDIRPARRLGLKTLWMAPESERSAGEEPGPGAKRFDDLTPSEWQVLLVGGDGAES